MKPGLSKREKILLFSVGLIALVYLSIQFVILPLATRYNDSTLERDRLNTEKAAHQMEVQTLPALRERNAEAHERFDRLTDGYLVIVPNDEIDHMLTSLVNINNLRPTSLRFDQRKAPPPPPAQELDEDGNPVESGTSGIPSGPVFVTVTAQMNVTGSYHSLVQLIDEVNAIEYMRLTSISFSQDRQEGPEDRSSISLAFEVTFLSA